MKSAEEILEKHRDLESKRWLKVGILNAMEEYASQFQQPKKETKTIEDRKHEFRQRVDEIVGQPFCFDKTHVEFFEYWTEIGDNQKKMRFEKEKVFDIKKRLERWKRNQKNFNNGKPEKRSTESAAHSFITE